MRVENKKIQTCLFLSIFLLLFFSCSYQAKSQDIVYISGSETLRYQVINLIDNSNWSKEIFSSTSDTNSSTKNNASSFFSEVKISSDLFIQKENAPIFPELKDFGSLDLSSLHFTTKTEITKLLNKIKEENITKTDFLPDFSHEKILLNYELSKHGEILSYILGKPISQTETNILIPVRFIFQDGKLNTIFELQKQEDLFKIKRITFGEFFGNE